MKSKTIAIIGLGRFGGTLAKTVANLGCEVLGVDLQEDVVQRIAPYITHAVVADFRDEDAIRSLQLEGFDVVVISIGEELQAKLMAAMVLKEAKVPYLIAKASSDMEGKLLEKIGVNEVIYPEFDMASRVAHMLTREHVVDYFDLGNDVGIVEMEAPAFMVGKNLIELNLRVQYNVNIVAIKRSHETLATPNPHDPIRESDEIIVIGKDKDITRLSQVQE